jgi:hypothetical protein
MIPENSGKIYRFAMDHGLGYGLSEVYDFTDHSMFDGRYAYVYNKIDSTVAREYNMDAIRATGIALGPITFYKFPNVRGIGAWKYLFQTADFLLTERPPSKELRGMHQKNDNWAELGDWYQAPYDMKKMPSYVPYEQVRHLETRILNGPGSVVKKFSMKTLIDNGKRVSDYYDLTQLGTKNMYVQLINTYYPLTRTIELLKDIPRLIPTL